jgi:hypothetical protein
MVRGPLDVNGLASLANVKKAGFVECESQPDWLEYDKLSWHQGSDKGEWQCFRATSDTVRLLAEKLADNGLLDGKLDIKTSSGDVAVELIGFRELKLAAADIREMASGRYRADLSDLPDELLY